MNLLIRYVSSDGEELRFGAGETYRYENTSLHDYSWGYDALNDHISRFRRALTEYTLTVGVRADTDGLSARNKLTEVFESDVKKHTPGRLYVGDSYIDCYVVGSTKSLWNFDVNVMTAELRILSEEPYWRHETTFRYVVEESRSDDHDYPYDYAYDYGSVNRSQYLTNPYLSPCKFRLTIYGPVVNPEVRIGANSYGVDTAVGEGCYLVIDSSERTVVLHDVYGHGTDAYDDRVRGAQGSGTYIFEDVPQGSSGVMWSGGFYFDLTLIEERSEPPWT